MKNKLNFVHLARSDNSPIGVQIWNSEGGPLLAAHANYSY